MRDRANPIETKTFNQMKKVATIFCVLAFITSACGQPQHTKQDFVVEYNDNGENELLQDFYSNILWSKNPLPDSIGDRLPANAKDYFSGINFPYKLLENLCIDWFCEKEKFRIEDFYIFKTKNDKPTCEYVALTNTSPFIEIVAQHCVDMENWILLYVLNENYKIIDSELLLGPFVRIGYLEEERLFEYNNQSIQFIDATDTLRYFNRQYQIFKDYIFMLTDNSGKEVRDIGKRRVISLTVNEQGKITKHDSIIHKREYYDLYFENQNQQ
jgi:hypothetical protein